MVAVLVARGAEAGDPERDLRSKDVAVRLAAVAELRRSGGEDAEELLLDALGDRDWEVVEHAAAALGEHGGEESVRPLLKTAITGPIRRIRIASLLSLGSLAPEEAGRQISRMVAGELAVPAAEALVLLGTLFPDARTEELRVGLRRALASKEVPVRRSAARGVGAFSGSARRELVEDVLADPAPSVQAALLDGIREFPDPDDLSFVTSVLDREELPDVLARRAIAAAIAIVRAAPEGEERERTGRRALSGATLAGSAPAAARFVRLAGLLAERPPLPEAPPPGVGTDEPPPLLAPEHVASAIDFGVTHAAPEVRAAAARALERIGNTGSIDRALGLAAADPDGRVRLHALRAVARTRGPADPAVRELLEARLGKDDDVAVREYAAVALGVRGLSAAVPALVKALDDSRWEVAVTAAVSLGMTGDERAVAPLRERRGHRDWKIAGAALVGLARVRVKDAVPDVIAALASPDTAVARSAFETLRRWGMQDRDPTVRAWTDWWEEVKDGFEFVDLDALAREQKKYGYAPTYRGVYENLDVIVLESRGDSIQKLLAKLSITHRMTRSAQVEDAGVNPYAVFVVNCTGEIVPKDVERLQWFVRVGGYLFGSCWALHETIEKVYPGVVRKLPIPGQVLANVRSEPCPTESPYLEEVFPDQTVEPIYVLYGSHLIEVLDPERVEVLIDSPECADTWPDGNLACWFDAGHGVILDSANHFDLQGLERAEGLKSADDRMAYAIDHMGLGYEEARELERKGAWRSQSKAAAETRDLSAFRFITNFVRAKRRADR